MSKDLAMKKESENAYTDILEALRPVIASVQPEAFIEPQEMTQILDGFIENAAADYARVEAFADLLFGPDIESYGKGATALFTQWEKDGGGPPLTAMIAVAADRFSLDVATPLAQMMFISALLAEFPNDLLYHGNEHYRKVLCHAIRLIATHNGQYNGTNRMLNKEQVTQLLAASCLHDLGHMGGDNLKEGVYTPGYMEQRALDIARPYFEAVGVDFEYVKDIESIVFCTDITFFAGDNSPCIRMKKIYKHYFWDDRNEDVSMMMMGKLRRFEDNPRLVLMAMLLHESDVATSAGLSYEQSVRETINIMGERGIHSAGPRTILAFLREQLGEMLFTEAGKQVFGRVMAQVIAQAEKEIEAGHETFDAA